MEDKEVLKKLDNLKDIKPDMAWKKSCREVLYSQISANRQISAPKSNIRIIWQSIMPREILINLTKPVWLASAASVLIIVVGIGGVYASKNSTPGDSLYIAKIISEKAQFAMTFDEKEKAKLSLEFAANRAKEMKQVLKDPNQNTQANNETIVALTQNFKKEISQIKKRLIIINEGKEQAKNEESKVFGANLGKSDQRIEIGEPAEQSAEPKNDTISPTEPAAKPAEISALKLTPESPAPLNGTSTPETASPTDQILKQAEKLFDENNLDGTIDKLHELNEVIKDSGEVRGVSETASSTK